MYGTGRIIPALAIFLGFMTFAVWYNAGQAQQPPKPEKPKDYKECVAPTEYMRTSHMVLLNEWRDDILRNGGPRTGVTANGTSYTRSLQNGCMNCHNDKKKFCDTCHTYAAVKPYCWDCHLEPMKEAM